MFYTKISHRLLKSNKYKHSDIELIRKMHSSLKRGLWGGGNPGHISAFPNHRDQVTAKPHIFQWIFIFQYKYCVPSWTRTCTEEVCSSVIEYSASTDRAIPAHKTSLKGLLSYHRWIKYASSTRWAKAELSPAGSKMGTGRVDPFLNKELFVVDFYLPSSLCILAFTDITVSKGETLSSKAAPVSVSIYSSMVLPSLKGFYLRIL